jgi:surface protein
MSWTFNEARSFDSDLSLWNTSRVTDMSYVFLGASSFTGKGVSNFDVRSVLDMHGAFYQSPLFDADLSTWQTGNVVDMSELFYGASSFRGTGIAAWDTSKVTLMNDMVRTPVLTLAAL